MEAWINETKIALDEEWKVDNELVDAEFQSLSKSKLINSGRTVFNVVYVSRETGFAGNNNLIFTLNKNGKANFSIFGAGDIVRFVPSDMKSKSFKELSESRVIPSGVVKRVYEYRIEVIFSNEMDDYLDMVLSLKERMRLDKLPDTKTKQVRTRILKDIRAKGNEFSPKIMPYLFESRDIFESEISIPLEYRNQKINEFQSLAIRRVFGSSSLHLIHGPPGTGKSTTVCEIIYQAVRTFKQKVLVCAPSNVAVDNIIMKLKKDIKNKDLRVVRLGHPARVTEEVQSCTLEFLCNSSEEMEIIGDIRKEVNSIVSTLYGPMKIPRSKKEPRTNFRELKQNLKESRKDMKMRQNRLARDIVRNANVVCCTCIGSDQLFRFKEESDQTYDLVIIDEASQALEVDCLSPIRYGKKLLLVGDHLQLPPTIKATSVKDSILSKTMFARLHESYGEKAASLLCEQYRMHKLINEWPSKEFYDGRLKPHHSVANRRLNDIHTLEENFSPLLLIDTSFCNYFETVEDNELGGVGSKLNQEEANLVVQHLQKLISKGLRGEDVAVVTPYSAQVKLIRGLLKGEGIIDVEVRTVDGFQGQEKSAIILSLVRSNLNREIGFLNDCRRMNVAITRAKAHVCLICDTECLLNGKDAGIKWRKSLIDHFKESGKVRSLFEDNGLTEFNLKEYDSPPIKKLTVKRKTLDQTRERLLKKVEEFLDSKYLKKFIVPSEANSFERQKIHSLCENHNVLKKCRVLHLTIDIEVNKRQLFLFKSKETLEAFCAESDVGKVHAVKLRKEANKTICVQNEVATIESETKKNEKVKTIKVVESIIDNVECVSRDKIHGDPETGKESALVNDEKSSDDQIPIEIESEGSEPNFMALLDSSCSSSSSGDENVEASVDKRAVGQENTSMEEIFNIRARKHEEHLKNIQAKKMLIAKKQNRLDSSLRANLSEVDDMTLLDSMIKANNECALSGCSLGGRFSLFTCRVCNLKYCGEHRYLHAHGCEPVKKATRNTQRYGRATAQRQVLKKKLSSLKQKRSKKKGKKKK